MASAPTLDIDALCKPISDDAPGGGKVSYDVTLTLKEYRTEVDPSQLSEDDPAREGLEAKSADWDGIIRLASEVLTEQSKDLRVAANLTEALTKKHGFAGLRDGLTLLDRLIDECWDWLQPELDPEDPEALEVRAGPFAWLDDTERGAMFPNSVRNSPLIRKAGCQFSCADWRASDSPPPGGLNKEDILKRIQAAPRQEFQDSFDDITDCLKIIAKMTSGTLPPKMQEFAPGMTGLSKVLGECRTIVNQLLKDKPPDQPADPGPSAEAPAEAMGGYDQSANGGQMVPAQSGQGVVPARFGDPSAAVATRADAYRQLQAAATLLRRLEPHSPIPYLVERAVELGQKPFPELMRAIIRNPDVLTEMAREFGLKDGDHTGS